MKMPSLLSVNEHFDFPYDAAGTASGTYSAVPWENDWPEYNMIFDSKPGPNSRLTLAGKKSVSMIMLPLLTGLLATVPVQAADSVAGAKLYARHCKNCHGDNGQGQLPGLPDFSRGSGLLESDIVLRNRIFAGQGMMPAYRGLLSEEEVLAIIAYLRTLHR